jgi:hypothetical protein
MTNGISRRSVSGTRESGKSRKMRLETRLGPSFYLTDMGFHEIGAGLRGFRTDL